MPNLEGRLVRGVGVGRGLGSREANAAVRPVAERLSRGLTAPAQGERALRDRVFVAVPVDELHVVAIDEQRAVLSDFDRRHPAQYIRSVHGTPAQECRYNAFVRRPLSPLFLLAGLTFLIGLGAPAITDSDEAFYAEAAREMVQSGDWLTPDVQLRTTVSEADPLLLVHRRHVRRHGRGTWRRPPLVGDGRHRPRLRDGVADPSLV